MSTRPTAKKLMKALVSIHDVMPSTLELTGELLAKCRQNDVDVVTLLVVPGLEWKPAGLEQLKRWCDAGCELAGHGWTHRCREIKGAYHRIHSWVLSRAVAEHLCLDARQITQLMKSCGEWFEDCGLETPSLYVPPAWALGNVSIESLSQTPFRLVETLSGVTDLRSRRSTRLPLVGFEADTAVRQWSVAAFNRFGIWKARRSGKPLRVSIHPKDHQLRLREALDRVLGLPIEAVSYRDLAW
jgi:predicted deacetylase